MKQNSIIRKNPKIKNRYLHKTKAAFTRRMIGHFKNGLRRNRAEKLRKKQKQKYSNRFD